MKVKVKELVPGQVIRVEYGDYENWVNFQVDAVKPAERYINVGCHAGGIHTTLAMEPEEMVEVRENA
jgi:hypothetical protein